jgi:hypothetical protein
VSELASEGGGDVSELASEGGGDVSELASEPSETAWFLTLTHSTSPSEETA